VQDAAERRGLTVELDNNVLLSPDALNLEAKDPKRWLTLPDEAEDC